VVAGAKSLVAIAEWAVAATPAALARIGVRGYPPCESTIRRTLQRMHADGLDIILGAWAALKDDTQGRRVIAIYGKSIRGAIGSSGPRRHLLAALGHGAGLVLGQVDVDAKTNEVPMLPKLLANINIVGAVITADAMHCVRDHATYLVERHAHYLLTVKGNQPKLRRQSPPCPGGCWDRSPRPGQGSRPRRDPDHEGRHHRRRDPVSPRASQAMQTIRKTRTLKGGKWTTETVYAVADLGSEQAQPQQLAAWLRGHWAIENRLSWVRDVTWAEDLSQIRTRLRSASDGNATKPGDHSAPTDRRDQHRSSHQTPSQTARPPNHTTADLLKRVINRECRGPGKPATPPIRPIAVEDRNHLRHHSEPVHFLHS